LLALLRAPMSAPEADLARGIIGEGFNWDALVSLARRHRVSPLVFWNGQKIGWPNAGAEVRARLEHSFHINASHTFALARELLHVGALLEEAGVAMVSFKGPTLAQAAYGSVGLRQFGDLDILVPRADVLRAREILHGYGYASLVPLAPSQEAAHLRDDSVFDLNREVGLDGRATSLELHWALTGRAFARPITFEHLRHRLRPAPLAGGRALQIEAADLLVILCVHGTKHLWERLQWIVDVAQLLRRAQEGSSEVGDLDWTRARALSVRFGVQKMLALGVLLAHELLLCPTPPVVLAGVRAMPGVEALKAQVIEGLFASQDEENATRGEAAALRSSWFLMRAMDSWGDRGRFALHVATTPPAEERASMVLPGPLERLRPLVRAAHLVSQYAWEHLAPLPSARRRK
jgi:hypothetical protein